MATVNEILIGARYDVRDPEKTQYSDDMMLDYMNRGLQGLQVVLAMAQSDWVNVQEDLTILEGTRQVSLPEYFISELHAVVNTTYLEKISVSDMRDKWLQEETGFPCYYSIHQTDLLLETFAPEDYTVKLEYNTGQAVLSLDSDMPYNDEFNNILRQFVTLLCKTRNEYTLYGDAAIQDFFYGALFSKLVARNFIPNVAKTEF